LLLLVGLQLFAVEMPAACAAAPGESPQTAPKEKSAAAPLKPLARLTGRVVLDKDATPVAGAEVRLVTRSPGESRDYGNLPVRKATTNEQGEFAFEGLAPGTHRVWSILGRRTSQRGQLQGEIITIPETGESPAPVELRLHEAAAVAVRVRSKADGQPIAGAVVHVDYCDVEDVRTDATGAAIFQPLVSAVWPVEVWADGCARETKPVRLTPGTVAELDFSLSPGGEIEGTVRDAEGKPLAGVIIYARPSGQPRSLVSVAAKTDADGRYRLAHLPLEFPWQLRAQKADYLAYQSDPLQVVETRRFDIMLSSRPHGGSIQGRVVDAQGRPIAHAELVNQGDRGELRQAKTGDDGRFLLENLYPSPNGAEVVARAAGFAAKSTTVAPGPADAPSEVTLTLESGHRLAGRVVDEQGRPLEGVSVSPGYGSLLSAATTTDREGRFVFDSLPADAQFSFSKQSYSPIRLQQLRLDEEAPITITMSPQGTIRGKAVDAATGRPLGSFTVRLWFSPQRLASGPGVGIPSDLANPGLTFRPSDGFFEVSDLVLGFPLQVTVLADGYERGVQESVVARAPGEAPIVEFSLQPEDPATLTTYAGRFVDAQGKPVAGAELRLIAAVDRPAEGRNNPPFSWSMIRNGQLARQASVLRFIETVSDRDGRFDFPRIPRKAETELVWWGKGVAPGRRDHLEQLSDVERGQIEISLEAPAKIEGQVDRKAFPEASAVLLWNPSTLDQPPTVNLKPDQEAFEFFDLAAGSYVVRLVHFKPAERGGAPFKGMTAETLSTISVQLAPGEARSVEFEKK